MFCGTEALCTGQMKDERPCGFVRIINKALAGGSIYEGFMDRMWNMEGFGRIIYSTGDQHIGWFKENERHGNCQIINQDGNVHKEGWYQHGYHQGDYCETINEFLGKNGAKNYFKRQIKYIKL